MKKLLLITITTLSLHAAHGQIALTLDDAIATALKNKPSIEKARHEEALARTQWEESKQKFIPDIKGEFTFQYNPMIPTSIIPVGQFNAQQPTDETRAIQLGQPWSNSAGIRGKQVLYSPGLSSELKERRLSHEKASLASALETENIQYNVSRSYYAALLAQEELQFAISDTMRTFQLYQVTSQRYAQQQVRITEQAKAQYDLLDSRFQYEKVKASAEKARLSLLYAIGLPSNTAISLSTTLSSLPLNSPDNLDSLSLHQRSDYRRATIDVQISQQQIKTEKSLRLPEIAINAFWGANQFTRSFNLTESNSWYGNAFVNVTASIPITGIYLQQKKIAQAKSRSEQSELSLKELEQSFDYELATARQDLSTAVSDARNQSESLQLSQQLYNETVNRYQAGQALMTEVQTAFTHVQRAQYRLLKATYDVLMGQLELKRLAGKR